MLALLSPAKSLDFETPLPRLTPTQPAFLDRSQTLISAARKLKAKDLSSMMGISEKLALLNVARFHAFKTPFTPSNARPAVYAFDGDVYTGLDAHSLTSAHIKYAQDHLRILSGLYGLLRPLDLIQPYRLEMGIALKTKSADTLYEFWGDALAVKLASELAKQKSPTLINLASQEYFRAVSSKHLTVQVITPVFKELRGNKAQIISFFAKKARGLMARYIVQARVDKPDGLKDFKTEGYGFDAHLSDDKTWIFTRRS